MRILGVIPARYASTRFPGKSLADIGGKPMIQHVYERSKQAHNLSEVVVATDDSRIYDSVKNFDGKVLMTSESHQTGTDRCNEVVTKMQGSYDVVINIQGDEPYINPEQIDQLCSCFYKEEAQIGTLIKKLEKEEDLFNPNKPKVIIDARGRAIYFSRHPIPFLMGVEKNLWLKEHLYYKHIGIYGYRTEVLKKITSIPQSKLELAERLEQLRWIESGFYIQTEVTDKEAYSVDTPEDLAYLLSKNSS